MRKSSLFILTILSGFAAQAQSLKIFGKITNAQSEPLAFVTIQIKEFNRGTTSREDGTYQLEIDEGQYELVISMIGYKSRILSIVVGKKDV